MLEIRTNHNRNVVCVFSRGPKITHFLGLEGGPYLKPCHLRNEAFEREYGRVPTRTDYSLYTPMDFANKWVGTPEARSMIPIAPTALRILRAIIEGQQSNVLIAGSQLNYESTFMSKAKNPKAPAAEKVAVVKVAKTPKVPAPPLAPGEFRRPEGPVAKVHRYLDANVDAIKAGAVSRKAMIEAMMADGLANGTVVTQCGVWARNNGVSFSRPTPAEKAADKAAATDEQGDAAAQ